MSEQSSAPATAPAERAAGTAPPPAAAPPPSPPTAEGRRSVREQFLELRNLGLLAVLAILVVVGVATSPTFFTSSNAFTILTSAAVIGVVVVGQTFVIIGGGIDLSVGAILALASVWSTTLATQSYGFWGVVFTALIVGTATGLINGLLIAYGRLVPFIATLAMLASARGVAERISNRHSQVVNVQSINNLALNKLFGIPELVLILAGVVVLGWVLLNRTTFGRRTFAIGGNPEAARLAGIPVRRHTALLYALSGLTAGIGAILLAALTTTGSSTHGTLYELDSIAAVIIGGTLLTGGRGTLIGSVLGVLVFTTITNLFVLNNLETDIQNIAKGVIIVAAVLVQMRSKEART